jgi:hypothetical protein
MRISHNGGEDFQIFDVNHHLNGGLTSKPLKM